MSFKRMQMDAASRRPLMLVVGMIMSRSKWIIMSTAILLAGILFIPVIGLYELNAFICINTGKKHGYTEWISGLRTNKWSTEGPIEQRLSVLNIKVSDNWMKFRGTTYNVFGKAMHFRHERPGEILHLTDEDMMSILDNISDDQILKLIESTNNNQNNLLQEIVNTTTVDHLNKRMQQTPLRGDH